MEHSPVKELNKIFTGAMFFHGIGLLFAFIIQILLAKTLSVSDFGRFTYAYQTAFFCLGLSTSGFSYVLLCKFARIKRRELLSRILGQVVCFSTIIVIAVIFILSLNPLGSTIRLGYFEWSLVGALAVFGAMINLASSALIGLARASLAYFLESFLKNLFVLLGLALCISLWELDNPIMFILALISLVYLLSAAVLVFILRASLPDKVEGGIKDHEVIDALWFRSGVRLTGVAYSILLLRIADIYALAAFSTAEDVAIYGLVIRIVEFFLVVPALLNGILTRPYVKAYEENNENEFREITFFYRRWTGILGAIMFILCLFFGKLLLGYVGEEYIRAYVPLLIMAGSFYLTSLFVNCSVVLYVIGEERYLLASSVLCSFSGMILTILLTYYWGVVGVSVGISVSYVMMKVSWLLGAHFKTQYKFKQKASIL